MRYRLPKTQFEKVLHKVCLLTLLVGTYFMESTKLTSASSFQVTAKKKYTARVPASINQVFEFDCQKPHEFQEFSTQHETIRLVTKNCNQKPELFDLKMQQKLLTFPLQDNQYSSEYAYLSTGDNTFEIKLAGKAYKTLIIRY